MYNLLLDLAAIWSTTGQSAPAKKPRHCLPPMNTVCELGNINGCPHYGTCKCYETLHERMKHMKFPPANNAPYKPEAKPSHD